MIFTSIILTLLTMILLLLFYLSCCSWSIHCIESYCCIFTTFIVLLFNWWVLGWWKAVLVTGMIHSFWRLVSGEPFWLKWGYVVRLRKASLSWMFDVWWNYLRKTILWVQVIWWCWAFTFVRIKSLFRWLWELWAGIISVTADLWSNFDIFDVLMTFLSIFHSFSINFITFSILWWMWIINIRLELLVLLT